MLKFVAAKDAQNEGVTLKPAKTSVDGETLGMLTMMVVNRFIESVCWDDVVSIYLSGLVDEEDMALIQRAVRALMSQGVEFNGGA